MGKVVYISEKPSVAQEFANALKVSFRRAEGFLDGGDVFVTWCVGHLVTMSYPEKYDARLKKWNLMDLPFLPEDFLYEILPNVAKQFNIVKALLTREDVDTIYVCTDAGREGEYIYRLVSQMAGVKGKIEKRVWIDSQTEEEISRGIREAKDLSAYNNLSTSAYLRAKEDYLMGINFSRLLTLKYSNGIAKVTNKKYVVLAVGRVMTCVLGMVVQREREIRNFIKTSFYKISQEIQLGEDIIEAEWKVTPDSKYFESPVLYKDNGFINRENAEEFVAFLQEDSPFNCSITKLEKGTEKKQPPLLFNLAELQNECSKRFKINPEETLQHVQTLYERKLVTYPRTDARVLSTAIAKEIHKNLRGLSKNTTYKDYLGEILEMNSYKNLEKTRFVNDKAVTDHYAIIPTGQSPSMGISGLQGEIYDLIVRRFLSIFFPAAIYQKISLETETKKEHFFTNFKLLKSAGYLKVAGMPKDNEKAPSKELLEKLSSLKKGDSLSVNKYDVKEGETTPPKRYTSGNMILAMENAGKLIEDEELRSQIKGSGIGTSATRSGILKKLFSLHYLRTHNKTQIIYPELLGELIYEAVLNSISQLLDPALTASWEKGLTYIANGEIEEDEYLQKLNTFIIKRTEGVKNLNNSYELENTYRKIAKYYAKGNKTK